MSSKKYYRHGKCPAVECRSNVLMKNACLWGNARSDARMKISKPMKKICLSGVIFISAYLCVSLTSIVVPLYMDRKTMARETVCKDITFVTWRRAFYSSDHLLS